MHWGQRIFNLIRELPELDSESEIKSKLTHYIADVVPQWEQTRHPWRCAPLPQSNYMFKKVHLVMYPSKVKYPAPVPIVSLYVYVSVPMSASLNYYYFINTHSYTTNELITRNLIFKSLSLCRQIITVRIV